MNKEKQNYNNRELRLLSLQDESEISLELRGLSLGEFRGLYPNIKWPKKKLREYSVYGRPNRMNPPYFRHKLYNPA